ncbi:MAG TPA: AI-2E family transporter [Candidatus Binatia bacterium]|nr:AI-2E family transporter [Candidatus Binatia bacterium]
MPTDRERIVQLFFFGFLAVMAYELYRLVLPFLTPIAWGLLLAFMVHPLQVEVTRLVRSRSLAAALISVAVGVLVVAPSLWMSGRLASEASALYGRVSALAAQGGVQQMHDWLLRERHVAALGRRLAERGYDLDEALPRLAMEAAQLTSDYVVKHLTNVARNAVKFVFDLGIALLVFFYALRDGDAWAASLRALTPLHEEDKAAVFESLRGTLSSVMRGLMLSAVLQGATVGLGLLAAGVPYWAFLATLAMALGLLPFGGTALVWIPAAGYLVWAAGWPVAIALAAWCTLAVAVIDNVVKPLAMGHGSGLPTVALFFGVAGGLAAYGPLGLFAGPAIISVLIALLRVFRRTYGVVREGGAGARGVVSGGA